MAYFQGRTVHFRKGNLPQMIFSHERNISAGAAVWLSKVCLAKKNKILAVSKRFLENLTDWKPLWNEIPSLKLTACPWKLVIGRLLSFWEGPFSGAMLVLWRVKHHFLPYKRQKKVAAISPKLPWNIRYAPCNWRFSPWNSMVGLDEAFQPWDKVLPPGASDFTLRE